MGSSLDVNMVRGAVLLRHLSAAEMQSVLDVCEDCCFEAGERLFPESGSERSLYLVVDGQLELWLKVNGSELLIGRVKSLQSVGESGLFAESAQLVEARCSTSVRALRLTRGAYTGLVETNYRSALLIAANVAGIVSRRLHATDRWIAERCGPLLTAESVSDWQTLIEGMQVL